MKTVKIDYSKNTWKEENRGHGLFVSWLATYQWKKTIENYNSVDARGQKVEKVVYFLAQLWP